MNILFVAGKGWSLDKIKASVTNLRTWLDSKVEKDKLSYKLHFEQEHYKLVFSGKDEKDVENLITGTGFTIISEPPPRKYRYMVPPPQDMVPSSVEIIAKESKRIEERRAAYTRSLIG